MNRPTHPGRASSVDDDDAPDAVVTQRLHDARDFIRRLRRHAPTNQRTRTRQSFDSRTDSRRHRGIESNLDDGVMMSRAVRMASTRARERERKKGASRSRGRSRVRSVARVDDASSCTHACMHSCMHSRARVVEDVCLVPDVYGGMSPRVRSICPSRVR